MPQVRTWRLQQNAAYIVKLSSEIRLLMCIAMLQSMIETRILVGGEVSTKISIAMVLLPGPAVYLTLALKRSFAKAGSPSVYHTLVPYSVF
jgi:hypothetical protein